MSTFSPFPFTDFGGLDLTNDPDESTCIDCLNVDLDKRGSVRSRDGYTKLNAVANPVSFSTHPYVWKGQNRLLASGTDGKLYVYNAAGTLLYTSGVYDSAVSVAEFGTGTGSYVYFSTNAQINRLTTAGVFSSPAGMPTASPLLAVQPGDNRLVAANVDNFPSRVRFSDPGDAETWGTNNYEDLHPNDGQSILGLTAWSNLLFAFKQSKFFVFFGNSVASDGNPEFNYRTIDAGVGGGNPVVAPDGVYFTAPDGIYRTTGGPPVKVSHQLDPLFSGPGTPFCSLTAPFGVVSPLSGGAYRKNRLYYALNDSGSANTYIFVYDIPAGQWLVWQTAHRPVLGLASFALSSTSERLTFTSGTRLYTFGLTDTTDDGTGITSRYRSGFTPLNWIRRSGHWYPIGSQEATVRESVIDGTGTIKFSMSRDFGAVPTTAGGAKATVTLGTAPAVAQGRHTVTQQGRRVSYQIEDDGTGSAWRVYDLTMHIDDARYPGLETS